MIFEFINSKVKEYSLKKTDQNKIDRLKKYFLKHYKNKKDPWGFDHEFTIKVGKLVLPFYKNYFAVKFLGNKKYNKKQYMVISNHTGQIAIDAMLIQMAFALENKDYPLFLRAMVDKYVSSMPFLGKIMSSCGAVLGERKNGEWLLKNGESLLIFPEGIKGISKDSKDFYHVQNFTKGFIRLALKYNVEIIPVAVVGAEEFYPIVKHFRKIAKRLGLPILPITPLFPLLGPLGMIPMPSPVDIYVGKPYKFNKKISWDAIDSEISIHVENIKNEIQAMVGKGLKKRRVNPIFEKLGIAIKKDL